MSDDVDFDDQLLIVSTATATSQRYAAVAAATNVTNFSVFVIFAQIIGFMIG